MRDRDAERSLEIASGLRHVPLRYAARLTLVLADCSHPLYEPAALRFLERTISEIRPPVIEVKKLADGLAHVHHGFYGWPARLALQDVVGQLYRLESSVRIEFDSLEIGGPHGAQDSHREIPRQRLEPVLGYV
jgi:hypothetical protein